MNSDYNDTKVGLATLIEQKKQQIIRLSEALEQAEAELSTLQSKLYKELKA